MTQPDGYTSVNIGAVMGDLHITPWQGNQAQADVRVSCGGEPWRPLTTDVEDLEDETIIQVAGSVALTIAEVQGDLGVNGLVGPLVVDEVQGDVTAHNLRSTLTLGSVHGDLTILDLGGRLQVGEVHGDARIRTLHDGVMLTSVQGDLGAQDLAGGITATMQGDALLETQLAPGKEYTVEAEEIVLRARGPINAQFVAQSAAGEIRTHLPLSMERHRRHLVGVLGKGEATVTLTSGGDILLDGAGTHNGDEDAETREAHAKKGFRLHISGGATGPQIDIHGPGDEATGWWPFRGGFTMSTNPQSNDPQDMQEIESRLRDFGERTGRAARKAAEKAREYADRAAARAKDTDWEAVSRDVRSAIERTVGELETTFREIAAEFQSPPPTTGAPGSGTAQTTRGNATAQRIPVDRDPVDGTATSADRDARRRAILEQVRSGDLTLEEAEERLRGL